MFLRVRDQKPVTKLRRLDCTLDFPWSDLKSSLDPIGLPLIPTPYPRRVGPTALRRADTHKGRGVALRTSPQEDSFTVPPEGLALLLSLDGCPHPQIALAPLPPKKLGAMEIPLHVGLGAWTGKNTVAISTDWRPTAPNSRNESHASTEILPATTSRVARLPTASNYPKLTDAFRRRAVGID